MKRKKVIIIGAGPGGLSCGMILANKGYEVQIFEKNKIIGGRNGFIQLGDFTFDIGPTFFMMKNVLDEIFSICNKNLDDYVELAKLEPMYRLVFKDKNVFPSSDKEKMISELDSVFPGSSKGYLNYLEKESKKFEKLIPCLQIPYGKVTDYFKKRFINSLPYLDAHVSLFDVLGRYFDDEDLRLTFTFQAKYIGMSPWEAPGTFSIISFIEHNGGIYHVNCGLHKLSEAMAKSIKEDGGNIFLSSPVRKINVVNKKAVGIELENGEKVDADFVVINADFAYAMKNIIDPDLRSKYTNEKIDKMKYSCSTFMLYLGIDKIYNNINHHNIFFADNYKNNVYDITTNKILSDDTSFYIQNASITDKTLAPEGQSTLYVLVPVTNNTSDINWNSVKEKFKNRIIDLMETKAGLNDLRKHIVAEKIITPYDWQENMSVHNGATFNLAHNLTQMLYFRPHNEFEEFGNCYLVGGGTHPGSGLPTIYESGRISAELIINKQ